MRLKTLFIAGFVGMTTFGLTSCSASEEQPPTLEGQITVNDSLKVSYKNVELAPEVDIAQLVELNPEVSAFEQGYIPLYLTISVNTTETNEEQIIQDINENLYASAVDSVQVGALPVTKGTNCDSSVLTKTDKANWFSYCKLVLLEPEKDPNLVGIGGFDVPQVFNTPPVVSEENLSE